MYGRHFRTKYVCFSNGTASAIVPVNCNAVTKIHNSKTRSGLRARSLAHHFKQLQKTKLGDLYGSDATHRFCPFVQEVLYDGIREVPKSAEVVACATIKEI